MGQRGEGGVLSATPPLLMLAEGRKPRPRKATIRPLEIHLHMAVAKLLGEHCLPNWMDAHCPWRSSRCPHGPQAQEYGP
jgi:hypothetical protein